MANVNPIAEQVNNFLALKVSLRELEDWSAEYSWNIHQRADSATQKLAYVIQSRIAEFGDGLLDELALRRELERAVRHLQPSPV